MPCINWLSSCAVLQLAGARGIQPHMCSDHRPHSTASPLPLQDHQCCNEFVQCVAAQYLRASPRATWRWMDTLTCSQSKRCAEAWRIRKPCERAQAHLCSIQSRTVCSATTYYKRQQLTAQQMIASTPCYKMFSGSICCMRGCAMSHLGPHAGLLLL